MAVCADGSVKTQMLYGDNAVTAHFPLSQVCVATGVASDCETLKQPDRGRIRFTHDTTPGNEKQKPNPLGFGFWLLSNERFRLMILFKWNRDESGAVEICTTRSVFADRRVTSTRYWRIEQSTG
jgi:hypothetical protein